MGLARHIYQSFKSEAVESNLDIFVWLHQASAVCYPKLYIGKTQLLLVAESRVKDQFVALTIWPLEREVKILSFR